ncbi:MAG: thioesterase [Bradyrhizobium sp.]|uniref:thioesterase II family protein n=1 Tax=Bradyrhizobium sp. TaxID=376 RepID=UPI001C2972B5|nr:alpha/beta fold hydrolase [Bradyrhizobium sp.]MBU6463204.1 alpha/beta fold hydrolase [Pseudomonadota bacterium]MDE2067011.1 thioesterase [Bradyrhizobium sp.]
MFSLETRDRSPEMAGRCFVRLQEPSIPPRLQLYCLPYAGGSARVFQSWRDILPHDTALIGVEYPGRGRRISERAIDRIDILASQLVGALADAPPIPYALFGHSMGALTAFEMAHQLSNRGASLPILLIVSGHGAASVSSVDNPVHASPDDEFLGRLRKLNATPPEVLEMPELLELIMPFLRADFRAAETYVPAKRPKLDIPIVAYGGLLDPDVSRAELLAWANETTAPCAVRMFPGDHFFLQTAPDNVVGTLVRDLTQALHASVSRVTPGLSQCAPQ